MCDTGVVLRCSLARSAVPLLCVYRMTASVAGTVGGTGIERISGSDKEGLLDVNRLDRCVCVHVCLPISDS